MNPTRGFRESPRQLKKCLITLAMEQLVTQLSAPHPFITSKPGVISLEEALGLPEEQPYMSLAQMISHPPQTAL